MMRVVGSCVDKAQELAYIYAYIENCEGVGGLPRLELTDRFCQTAKPKGKPQLEHFDTIVRGLSLLASHGGTRTFFLNYTTPLGKRARVKLGRYPEISLAQARSSARQMRGRLQEGVDPLETRRSARNSITVSDLVENYIRRHAHTRRTGPAIARRLRYNITAHIGNVSVKELHRRDITKCIDLIVDRGAPVEANRVFEDVRAMVRWARARGDLDSNLVEGMRRPSTIVERDRVLTEEEIISFWSYLPHAEMWAPTKRLLKLCLVTAQRVGEIAGMKLDEINGSTKVWTIPATRTKNGREHAVPLSKLALEIIDEQIEFNRLGISASNTGHVFPSRRGSRLSINPAAAAKAVKKLEFCANEKIKVRPFTPHDLRRTAATHMEALGTSPFVIGHVLNHISATKSSITSRVYARYSYENEKKDAIEAWSKRLIALISGTTGKK